MPFAKGRLFRIARPGLSPSYLLATVHIADPRVAQLSAAERALLEASATVAVEAVDDEEPPAVAATNRMIAAPDALRASQLLDAGDYARLEDLLSSRGFSPALARRLKAVALALMLDLPSCAISRTDRQSFLDAEVLRTARHAGVRVVGLETVGEQVSVADDLTAADQTALLRSVLAQADGAEDSVETTVRAYLGGHIGLLLAWSRSPQVIPGRPAAAPPPAVFDRIVTVRTRRMRDRLLPLLDTGGVFVAVGATHIPGADGLAALLDRAGYRVERVE